MNQATAYGGSSGAIVWLTGLPSSGKSRLARRAQAQLIQDGVACCVLDSDRVRSLLHPRPGYLPAERDDFYRTLGGLALELEQQGLIVLVPATANRRIYRDEVRARALHFIEVWMNAPLDECRRRDAKGLYAHFSSGEVHGLPGEDSTYEEPAAAEVSAHGGDDEDALSEVLRRVRAVASANLARVRC
ncbi:MAG: adenylyl-sulfate kinase [Polyangiaceae bacterium]